MIINTERFQLKSLTTKHVTEKYLSWFSESEGNGKYISFAQGHIDINDLMQYVSDREDKKDVLFFGIFADSRIHIGNVKYEPINIEEKVATMGILIGDKEWRGKGVAFEVIKASSDYLNKTYGIKYIDLVVNGNNAFAVSVYKKMKFRVVEENDNEFKMRLKLE
jgi:[ribosomal protein S5]-alanine N-acetyltransferase